MTETPTQTDQHPGCLEFNTTRRHFLRNVLSVAGASVVIPTVGSSFVQATFAATPADVSNVLVILSMRGGADGLSLVVPHAETNYYAYRRNIAIPTSSLLAIDSTFGLHPKFAPLMGLWNDGKMAAVQAVGLPAPNRSHFAAIEAVEDADPGSPERVGWLNRLISLDAEQSPIEGAQVGTALIPGSLYGPEPVLAITEIDDMFLPGRKNKRAYASRVASLRQAWQDVDDTLGQGARSAIELSREFEHLAGQDDPPQHGAKYPASDLGRSLTEAARLIRADIGAEVITVDSGSWDMHVALGTIDAGEMTLTVDDLAKSVAAFFQDLGPDTSTKVTVVTISEFGRRVQENANRGLDHGYGNVMFVMGGGVNGGYHGSWPGLGDEKLVQGDLAVTNDMRSVLAEVVRMRTDADVTKVFPGFRPEFIGCMTGA